MAFIHVVGINKLQNDLLLSFLKEKTGYSGESFNKLEYVNPVCDNTPELRQFILLDWRGINQEQIWSDIHFWRNSNSCQTFIAFCNVDPKVEIERRAVTNNIQGLFYNDDPLPVILKGITSILSGDLWFSRKTLKKCIMQVKPANISIDLAVASNLTLREKEILILIASGCSNKEIASKLCISSHTVKTHIYNIYKKINTDSRFQAALWAAKYL